MPFFPDTEVQSAWMFMKDNTTKQNKRHENPSQSSTDIHGNTTDNFRGLHIHVRAECKAWFCIFWNDVEI